MRVRVGSSDQGVIGAVAVNVTESRSQRMRSLSVSLFAEPKLLIEATQLPKLGIVGFLARVRSVSESGCRRGRGRQFGRIVV